METNLLKKAFAKITLLACKGYSDSFINNTVSINLQSIIPTGFKKLLPTVEGNKNGVLQYTNLSVLYNSKRKLPFLSAYNIDGGEKSKTVVRANNFRPDPRIDTAIQLSPAFYNLRTDIKEFEIGHMAANNEMAWGPEAQLQAYETFHFPNSAPQAATLNTGIWKTLESYIIKEAGAVENQKVCVFTGPLLRDDDPAYIKDTSFQIPLLFFKVVVFPTPKGIFSTGFMMSHEQEMIEQKMFAPTAAIEELGLKAPAPADFTDFKYGKVFQVNIKYMEQQTGLNFTWDNVQTIPVPNDKNQVSKIKKIENAKDADEAEKKLKQGIAPAMLTLKTDLTPKEIKQKNYRLNIILP